MENLILSFTVVFPLFLQLALGYFLKRVGLLDEHTLQKCNKLVFRVFLPVLLFLNVCNADIQEAFHGRLLLWAAIEVFICFCVLMAVIPLIEKDARKRAVLVQGIFRSNFALFGVSVAASLFGEENIGVASLLTAVVIPMYNILSVVALETFRGGKPNARKMLLGVVKNPLIIGTVSGLALLLLGIRLPGVVESAMQSISKVATPMSLLVLGGTFEFSRLRGSLREMAIGIVGRLIAVPAVFLPIFAALGFRGVEMGAVLVMLASPTAVSSFPMAIEMDADGTLAGQIVVGTTLLCVVTMFFWIFLLKELGWM